MIFIGRNVKQERIFGFRKIKRVHQHIARVFELFFLALHLFQ